MNDIEVERLLRVMREATGRSALVSIDEEGPSTSAASLVPLVGESIDSLGETAFPRGHGAERLVARAKAALGCEAPSLASLAVTVLGGRLRVAPADGRAGEVVEPRVLRGGDDGGVLVSHRLGRREVATSIHRSGAERFSVLMDLGSDAAQALTRVTVLRGDREVASEAARQGRVMLPELTAGRWRVRISDRVGWVGDLDLTLNNGDEV